MSAPAGHSRRSQALAESLAGTFPGSDDAPLARALLRELTRGEPVSAASLAASYRSRRARGDRHACALAERAPRRAGTRRGVRRSEPASRPSTASTSAAGGCTRGAPGTRCSCPRCWTSTPKSESTCPMTGTAVRLTVAPAGVLAAHPEDVWVSFPAPGQTSTADIVESFCCHVHFLAGADTAGRLGERSPGGLRPRSARRLRGGTARDRAFFATSWRRMMSTSSVS